MAFSRCYSGLWGAACWLVSGRISAHLADDDHDGQDRSGQVEHDGREVPQLGLSSVVATFRRPSLRATRQRAGGTAERGTAGNWGQ
jgi:hypothetical protein